VSFSFKGKKEITFDEDLLKHASA